jgi:hypothetical protein
VRLQIAADGRLSEHKVVSIGVKPLSLSSFTMAGVPYVFAATDRPAVVYARNGKLVYSPVNEQDVTMLCSFSTDAFPGAIAMAKDDCLMITQIDAIQKLHIRCALASVSASDAGLHYISLLQVRDGCRQAFQAGTPPCK